MANEAVQTAAKQKRHRSIFDLPAGFFESCRILTSALSSTPDSSPLTPPETLKDDVNEDKIDNNVVVPRWSCNTCKSEFDSLLEQRSHFKSDFHRFNVKLSIAGKAIVKEDDFDELTSDSLVNDYDVSSISGSEDEAEREYFVNKGISGEKHKLFISTNTGERISVWKSLLLDESQNVSFEKEKLVNGELGECEVIDKLKKVISEPRNSTCLRIVLLASGGHFAGCVFDGNSVVAHKTFHRYVVRAKAGRKQSSKDGSGRAAHSAGASLRRYNELGLKKDIQELLVCWKPYFDASSCIFIYAPSTNRQLLFNGEKPYFSLGHGAVRNVPLTVKRPTLKEARRVYNQLTQVAYELDSKQENPSSSVIIEINDCLGSSEEDLGNKLRTSKATEASLDEKKLNELSISSESESEILGKTTPLHEAVKSGNADEILKLLEQGLDPCIKDERGRTPYMLATEKEIRSIFRRFMASNLDKWDWHAAKVPSALTKEMEESQAAKQAEKDAKRKAKAKELKKLRKVREKKAQAHETAIPQEHQVASSIMKKQPQSSGGAQITKEEELKRTQDAEREKRAAAAERRLAALNADASSSLQPQNGLGDDVKCSCCDKSLAGIVPFHRYNYKYCSTSCMRVHREILEDG